MNCQSRIQRGGSDTDGGTGCQNLSETQHRFRLYDLSGPIHDAAAKKIRVLTEPIPQIVHLSVQR